MGQIQDGCQDCQQNTKVAISCSLAQLRRWFLWLWVCFQGHEIQLYGLYIDLKVGGLNKFQYGCNAGHQNTKVAIYCISEQVWRWFQSPRCKRAVEYSTMGCIFVQQILTMPLLATLDLLNKVTLDIRLLAFLYYAQENHDWRSLSLVTSIWSSQI